MASFLQRLGRLGGGEAIEEEGFLRALQGSYANCALRAGLLKSHADLAPQEYSTRALQDLAADEEQQRERLAGVLRERGLQLPSTTTAGAGTAVTNHWGRLVQDLELHRAAVRELQEFSMRFDTATEGGGPLFRDLSVEEAEHCQRLRALIARADPQALD
jgi:hypothetical protein